MKWERLRDRIKALEPTPPTNTENGRLHVIINSLTKDEQETLVDVIVDAQKLGKTPEDEAWLANRPQPQQAVVRKVLAASKQANLNAVS